MTPDTFNRLYCLAHGIVTVQQLAEWDALANLQPLLASSGRGA